MVPEILIVDDDKMMLDSVSALLECICNFMEITRKYPSAGVFCQAQGGMQVSG